MKIEIYPECPKPNWIVVGAWCYCHGEAKDRFKIVRIGKNAAILENTNGNIHGWESFTKLHLGKDYGWESPSLDQEID